LNDKNQTPAVVVEMEVLLAFWFSFSQALGTF